MGFTEEQKLFIKEKIHSKLPSSRIYLFYSCENNLEKQKEVDVMIFSERELSLDEKIEMRNSFCRILGGQIFNIASYRHGFEDASIKYALNEGIEL